MHGNVARHSLAGLAYPKCLEVKSVLIETLLQYCNPLGLHSEPHPLMYSQRLPSSTDATMLLGPFVPSGGVLDLTEDGENNAAE